MSRVLLRILLALLLCQISAVYAQSSTGINGGGPNGGTIVAPSSCSNTQIVFDGSGALTCSSKLTWTDSSSTASFGSVASPATLRSPDGSASNGANLTVLTGSGVGTNKNGGDLTLQTGVKTGSGDSGNINIISGGQSGGAGGDSSAGTITIQVGTTNGPDQFIFIPGGFTYTTTTPGAVAVNYQQTTQNATDSIEFQVYNGTGDGPIWGAVGNSRSTPILPNGVNNGGYFSDFDPTFPMTFGLGNLLSGSSRARMIFDTAARTIGDVTRFVSSGVQIGAPVGGGTTPAGTLNAQVLQVNGSNLLPVLSGTSGSIGGGALVAGACASGTVTVTGATTSMVVVTDPNTYPGDGAEWEGYVSAANTVTVKVCALVALTPTASTYNVRVIQ